MANLDFKIPEYKFHDLDLREREFLFKKSIDEYIDWGQVEIQIRKIWKEAKGKGIRVAILDSGITDLPDFNGAIKCARNFTKVNPGACNVKDISGHGTFIAGIIGARKNGSGMVGIAPECDLYIGKVAEPGDTIPPNNLIDGLNWVYEENINILSLSLRNSRNIPEVKDLIKKICDKGVHIICSGGNDKKVPYPAKYHETLAIGSIDKNHEYGGGAVGDEIDFVAPGVQVSSLYTNGRIKKGSGTSFSAPFIAGLSALILSKGRKKGKHISFIELRQELKKMSKDLGAHGEDRVFGLGFPKNWNFD